MPKKGAASQRRHAAATSRQGSGGAPRRPEDAGQSLQARTALAPPRREGGLQSLTEGAILAALAALLAIGTQYIPLLGLATVWLCPLPLAVLVIRHGFKTAAVSSVVATLVAGVFAGPVVGFLVLISFAPMGLVLGMGARRAWPAPRVVLVGAAVSSVSIILNVLGLLGVRLGAQEMAETMQRSGQMAAGLYSRLGFPQSQIQAVTASMQGMVELLPYLLPSMVIIGALSSAWFNYEIGRRVLIRFGYRLVELPPMRTWRLPPVTLALIGAGLLMLTLGARPGSPSPLVADQLGLPPAPVAPALTLLGQVGTGLTLAMQLLFMAQGLLAGWVILGNFELTGRERAVALVLVFSLSTTIPIINILLYMLGIVDSAWKVRERWGAPRSELSKVQR